MDNPIRSLIDPPGLSLSSLANSRHRPAERRVNSSSAVLPMSSSAERAGSANRDTVVLMSVQVEYVRSLARKPPRGCLRRATTQTANHRHEGKNLLAVHHS